jgi:hypothetical protein
MGCYASHIPNQQHRQFQDTVRSGGVDADAKPGATGYAATCVVPVLVAQYGGKPDNDRICDP